MLLLGPSTRLGKDNRTGCVLTPMICPHLGPALPPSHWSGKQPKSYPKEITALLVKRSHEIFSPDQVQLLTKDSYKGKLSLSQTLNPQTTFQLDGVTRVESVRESGEQTAALGVVCVCPVPIHSPPPIWSRGLFCIFPC